MTREEARKELSVEYLGDSERIIEAKKMAIKALEQEPCEDAVSRQTVVELIEGWWLGHTKEDDLATEVKALPSVTPTECIAKVTFDKDELQKIVDEKVKELTVTQRWIPVSERLPEDIKPVIITWKNTDPKSYYQYIVGKHFIGTAHYKNGKWFCYSSVTEDLLAEYGKCDSEEFDEAIEVVAWMPLPEPYKAESEDKK